MVPKNIITQLLFVFSLASLSICHIIRRDAIDETSVAMVTEDPSSNELVSLDSYPNDLTFEEEDDAEDHQEVTNELGNFQQEDTCYEPSAQRLRLNFKQSNQNVKFPALAILKKENAGDDLVYGRPDGNQPGDGSAVEPQAPVGEYVNTTCPRELLHVSGHDDLSKRSLCPWTYVADVDPNRYPSKIMFAVCRCPECIRTGSEENGEFSVDNTCHQVYFRMKVLRKGSCVNGLYVYNTEYENIPVACTCVRPKRRD